MNVLIPEDLLARRAARGEVLDRLKRSLCVYSPSPAAAAGLIDSWFAGDAQRAPKSAKRPKPTAKPSRKPAAPTAGDAMSNVFPAVVQPIAASGRTVAAPPVGIPQPLLPPPTRKSFTLDLSAQAAELTPRQNNPAVKLLQQLESRWKHVRAPETVQVTVTHNSLTIKNNKTLVYHEIPLVGNEPHTSLTAVAPPWYSAARRTYCTAVACSKMQEKEVIVWVFDIKRAMLIGRWERSLLTAAQGVGKIEALKNGMLALVSSDRVELIRGGNDDYSTKMELWAEVHSADINPSADFEFLSVGDGPVVCVMEAEGPLVVGEIHKGGQSCWWRGELNADADCVGMQFDKFMQILTLRLARGQEGAYVDGLRGWYRSLPEDARVNFLMQEFLPAWKDHARGGLTAARWMTEQAWGLPLSTVLLDYILAPTTQDLQPAHALVSHIMQLVEQNNGDLLDAACLRYGEEFAGHVEFDTSVQACLELHFSKKERS